MYWTTPIVTWMVLGSAATALNVWNWRDAKIDLCVQGKEDKTSIRYTVALGHFLLETLRVAMQLLLLTIGPVAASVPPEPVKHPFVSGYLIGVLLSMHIFLAAKAVVARWMRREVARRR